MGCWKIKRKGSWVVLITIVLGEGITPAFASTRFSFIWGYHWFYQHTFGSFRIPYPFESFQRAPINDSWDDFSFFCNYWTATASLPREKVVILSEYVLISIFWRYKNKKVNLDKSWDLFEHVKNFPTPISIFFGGGVRLSLHTYIGRYDPPSGKLH